MEGEDFGELSRVAVPSRNFWTDSYSGIGGRMIRIGGGQA
jgi:hypothetical protein